MTLFPKPFTSRGSGWAQTWDAIQPTTGRSTSRRHNNDSIKLGAQLPGHFRLSCLQNQQAEKGVILLAWLVEMTIKRRLGCYYTNEDKEEHGNTGDPKATLPVGKSNEGRTTNGPDSSEMKVRSPQQP